MLTLGKFNNFQPFPREVWGLSHPIRHNYHIFDHAEQRAIPQFWSGDFGKKNERGRGPSCPPLSGHLKRALELLISVLMSPPNIF